MGTRTTPIRRRDRPVLRRARAQDRRLTPRRLASALLVQNNGAGKASSASALTTEKPTAEQGRVTGAADSARRGHTASAIVNVLRRRASRRLEPRTVLAVVAKTQQAADGSFTPAAPRDNNANRPASPPGRFPRPPTTALRPPIGPVCSAAYRSPISRPVRPRGRPITARRLQADHPGGRPDCGAIAPGVRDQYLCATAQALPALAERAGRHRSARPSRPRPPRSRRARSR